MTSDSVLSSERLAEMLAGLDGVTPGPYDVWVEPTPTKDAAIDELAYQVMQSEPFAEAVYLLNADGKCPATTGCGPSSEANAHHFARCDPDTMRAILTELLSRRSLDSADGVEPTLYGPYGWLNGHRGLSEDSWHLESDPLENNEEYFAIPLYAKVDPFVEVGIEVASRPACTAEAEPVAWLWTDAGGRLNASIHSEKWDRKSYVATMGGAPLYLAPPSPAQSAIVPPVVEVTEEMVEAAMETFTEVFTAAIRAGQIGDDNDAVRSSWRAALLAALQAQHRGE